MTIRKLFRAEVAHRLTSAYTKRCLGIHGHSYKFEIFIESKELDSSWMVMDFKMLKERLYAFLDAFDHTLLIDAKDTFLVENAAKLNPRYIIVPYNPTAEMIALHIYLYAKSIGLNVQKTVVHETEGGCAICDSAEGLSINLKEVIFSKELKQEEKRLTSYK